MLRPPGSLRSRTAAPRSSSASRSRSSNRCRSSQTLANDAAERSFFVGVTRNILQHALTTVPVQVAAQAAEGKPHEVAMVQLRTLFRFTHFEPDVVQQIDILRPQTRRMR